MKIASDEEIMKAFPSLLHNLFDNIEYYGKYLTFGYLRQLASDVPYPLFSDIQH